MVTRLANIVVVCCCIIKYVFVGVCSVRANVGGAGDVVFGSVGIDIDFGVGVGVGVVGAGVVLVLVVLALC